MTKGIKGFQKGYPNYVKERKIKVNCNYCSKEIKIQPCSLKWDNHLDMDELNVEDLI